MPLKKYRRHLGRGEPRHFVPRCGLSEVLFQGVQRMTVIRGTARLPEGVARAGADKPAPPFLSYWILFALRHFNYFHQHGYRRAIIGRGITEYRLLENFLITTQAAVLFIGFATEYSRRLYFSSAVGRTTHCMMYDEDWGG